jgi:hypothetical protein
VRSRKNDVSKHPLLLDDARSHCVAQRFSPWFKIYLKYPRQIPRCVKPAVVAYDVMFSSQSLSTFLNFDKINSVHAFPNLHVDVQFVKGVDNVHADALSRGLG